MNNIRRRQIKKWIKQLQSLQNELNDILDDEQGAFDNMPENLQLSFRGMDIENAIQQIELAIDTIDDVISCVEDAMG